MSRGLTSTLRTLAQASVQKPALAITSSPELLSFGFVTTGSVVGTNFNVPWSTVMTNSTSSGYIAGRGASQLHTKAVDFSSANFNLNSGTGLSMPTASMQGSFYNNKFYFAQWINGSDPIVYTSNYDGTSVTSLATITGQTMSNGSGMTTRVESVQATANGIIVALGFHNWSIRVSTIKFFYVSLAGTVVRLKHFIQVPHDATDAYTGNYYDVCLWAPHIFAIARDSDIVVIANTHQKGGPVQFALLNIGVESAIQPAIAIDPAVSDTHFMPQGLCKIGSLYYLSGYYERVQQDGVTQYVEGFLTSDDAEHWSVGDWSSFVTTTQMHGVLVAPLSNGQYIYFVGRDYAYRALARPSDTSYATSTNLADYWMSIGLTSSEALSGKVQFRSDTPALSQERSLLISMGYYDSSDVAQVVPMGKLMMDQIVPGQAGGVNTPTEVKLLDYATWQVKSWQSPVDTDRWSRTMHEDDLKKANQTIFKTPVTDVKNDENAGLVHDGLNTPAVVYATGRDERDGMARATVRFGTTASQCLSAFAFVFGGATEQFNAFTVPKTNSWTGFTHPRPQVMTSNLDPTDKWQVTQNLQGLIKSALASTSATMLQSPNASASPSAEYITSFDWGAAANTDYELVLDVFGDEVALYARTPDNTDANVAANAAFTLISKWRFNQHTRKAFDGYWGFACNTDVWAKASNAIGDGKGISTSLTDADEASQFTNPLHTGTKSSAVQLAVSNTSGLAVGMTVRLLSPSAHDALHTITAISTNTSINVSVYRQPTVPASLGGANGASYTIYTQSGNDIWGTASSGYVKDDIMGTTVVVDPGGEKKGDVVVGRGVFLTDDTTAMAARAVASDGINHAVWSGSAYSGGTYECWDATTPVAIPRAWRFYMRGGRFFDGNASQYGLPSSGIFKIGDEKMRYVPYTFARRGAVVGSNLAGTLTWTICPTWVSPLAARTAPVSNLDNFVTYGGQQPGDDLSLIGTSSDPYGVVQDPAGLLVEIEARNLSDGINLDDVHYRVSSIGGGVVNIDPPYPNSIVGAWVNIDHPSTTTPERNAATGGDFAIISGYGAMGSDPDLHTPDEAMCFYPSVDMVTPLSNLIQVKRFDFCSGLYNSVEDDLKYTLGSMGVRGCTFADRYSFTGTLGTPTTVSGITDADFMLEYTGPLNNSTTGIDFTGRGYYGVRLLTDTSGNVTATLHIPGSTITASGGYKKVEEITKAFTNFNISGTPLKVRVIFKQHTITVEIAGRLFHVFQLKSLGQYDYYSSGAISVGWRNSSGSYASVGTSITFRIPDLADNVENHAIDMGGSGESAISDVLNDRHVFFRPNASGGFLFSRFDVREDLGSYSNLVLDAQPAQPPNDQPGHVVVSGADFGEYIKESHIQAHGYRFMLGSNDLLDTPADSRREAQLLVRQGIEQTRQASFTAPGLPHWEFMDLVTLSSTSVGNTPYLTATQYAVAEVNISLAPGSFTSAMTLNEVSS